MKYSHFIYSFVYSIIYITTFLPQIKYQQVKISYYLKNFPVVSVFYIRYNKLI